MKPRVAAVNGPDSVPRRIPRMEGSLQYLFPPISRQPFLSTQAPGVPCPLLLSSLNIPDISPSLLLTPFYPLFVFPLFHLKEAITDCDTIQYADDTRIIHTGCADTFQDLIYRAEATIITKDLF